MLTGLIVFIIFVVLLQVYLYIERDRLREYRDSLGLEKTNIVYAKNYQSLKDLILPSRRSVFSGHEPVTWLLREAGTEMFLAANNKGDLRIWFRPNAILTGLHIVLDGTLNNSIKSNLKTKKLPEQQIQLEGNFSDHFRLYCGKNQQVVALQIIAPDVMSYLLDHLLSLDIEIIDDQVAIISKGGAKSLDTIKSNIEIARRIDKLTRAAKKVTRL